MVSALIVCGVVCLLIGGGFYWLNTNTPVQTCIPVITIPLGLVCLVLALGGLVL
jgi:hypothetical protein